MAVWPCASPEAKRLSFPRSAIYGARSCEAPPVYLPSSREIDGRRLARTLLVQRKTRPRACGLGRRPLGLQPQNLRIKNPQVVAIAARHGEMIACAALLRNLKRAVMCGFR